LNAGNAFLRRCAAALHAFTCLPVAAPAPDDARACARHWPGVGFAAGMVAALAFTLVALPLPRGPLSPLVAAAASTLATGWLVGLRQEESLLRTSGTLALVLAIAAKLALLGVLGLHAPAGVLAALVAAHASSRFLALLLAWSLPRRQAELQPRGHPFAQAADRRALGVAAAWCVVPWLLMLLAGGAWFLLLAVVVAAIAFALLRQRLQRQPLTPDAIHAARQVLEIAFYLGAAFAAG